MNSLTSRMVLMGLIFLTWYGSLDAQGFGRGPGGSGRGPDQQHAADQQVFHYLLAHHEKIRRTVQLLDNGVETVTESDDPKVASTIQKHVRQMTARLEKPAPIRMRDPLFAELFRHAKKIKIEHQETAKGVKVRETSRDAYVVKLIQAHANVVSAFVEKGFAEASKSHPVPDRQAAKPGAKTFPKIENHGGVFKLPDATHQPRAGSKIVVDVTRSAEPDQLNPAIEKLARFVNIYAGAGKQPATVDIAVVFHGGATLAVLNDEAYQQTHQTKGNPNLELLRTLHHAGVQLIVCGQSLQGHDKKKEDVAVFIDTAVSALTANVNLQSDGYAYIPLGN